MMKWIENRFDLLDQAPMTWGDFGFMILLSTTITVVFVLPILIFLGQRVKAHLKDMRENWTTVQTVMTEGYVYQVHNQTGERRVTSLLVPKPPINREWLKGRSDDLGGEHAQPSA